MSKESLTNQPEEPVPPLARDLHFKLTSRLPPFARKRKKITPVLQAIGGCVDTVHLSECCVY